MNVVITLAGHSRRFQQAGYSTPKPFILIDGRPMIAHVVDMFDPNDKFFFVLNNQQTQEHPEYPDQLRSLAKSVSIEIIPPHETGPVYSALQVKNIPEDEDVIVTYCDFTVGWNYRLFLQRARGHAAALPVFKGFHPASFGNTYYAYIRNEGDRYLELREKQSFTPDRTQEFASVGIYYFSTWKMFKEYSHRLLKEKNNQTEAYVSLLYNLIVKDNPDIIIDEVNRFICWGTPEDLEQYYFWGKYFAQNKMISNESEKPPPDGPPQINLIPMAGRGTRFKNDQYRVTKPLIQVSGKPMVISSAISFPPADKWIFAILASELDRHPLEKTLKKHVSNCDVIRVQTVTSGQAATCLLAKEQLDPKARLFIASCDFQTVYNEDKWRDILRDQTIDGAIWTIRMGSSLIKDPGTFSYCRLHEGSSFIKEVVEKKTISDHPAKDPLVVGGFWYRRAADFIRGAETMINRGTTINGEHNVAASINTLIEEGLKFVNFEIDQWISFGDPFELHVFEYWQDHFHESKQKTDLTF